MSDGVQWIEFTIVRTTTTAEYETYRAMTIPGSEDVCAYNVTTMRSNNKINRLTADLIETDREQHVSGWVLKNMWQVEAPSDESR